MLQKTSLMTTLLAVGLTLTACTTTQDPATGGAPVDKATAQTHAQVQQFLRLGDRTKTNGDLKNAIAFYQRAYSLTPDDKVTIYSLADALEADNQTRAVELLYADALSRKTNDADLLRRHANALIKLDKLPQAIIQLQKVITQNPNDQQAHNSLGVAYDLQGRHSLAQSHYRQNKTLSGTNNLALSLALEGKFEDAILLLFPFESDLSVPERYRLNLALIYGLKGDETSAKRVAGYILDREAVEHNLKIYRELRQLSDNKRTKAVLGM